jgi:hypothetical protein
VIVPNVTARIFPQLRHSDKVNISLLSPVSILVQSLL